jgi:hypothetical protein
MCAVQTIEHSVDLTDGAMGGLGGRAMPPSGRAMPTSARATRAVDSKPVLQVNRVVDTTLSRGIIQSLPKR